MYYSFFFLWVSFQVLTRAYICYSWYSELPSFSGAIWRLTQHTSDLTTRLTVLSESLPPSLVSCSSIYFPAQCFWMKWLELFSSSPVLSNSHSVHGGQWKWNISTDQIQSVTKLKIVFFKTYTTRHTLSPVNTIILELRTPWIFHCGFCTSQILWGKYTWPMQKLKTEMRWRKHQISMCWGGVRQATDVGYGSPGWEEKQLEYTSIHPLWE